MELKWSNRAWKAVQRLDKPARDRLFERLEEFAENRRGDVRRLQGQPGVYRLRVADWRVLFSRLSEEDALYIRDVDHRSRAYRRRS